KKLGNSQDDIMAASGTSFAASLPGRHIDIAGEGQYLYFSGTAYLGISSNPEFLDALKVGIGRYGSHFGGSRRSNIQFDVIMEAEEVLAAMAGVEKVLTLSSGSLAGQMVSHYFEQRGRLALAPGTHPALWTPSNRPLSGDFDAWVKLLPSMMEGAQAPQALFLNSIDPLYARQYDLSWLDTFLDSWPEIQIIIDDSHGWGILGEHGRSVWELIPVRHRSKILVVSSLGKAFGMPGGMISGSSEMLTPIYNSPFFGGASPMSLPYFYAFLRCQNLFSQERETLRRLLASMENVPLVQQFFTQIKQHPVFYAQEAGLAAYLYKQKILISSFSYPGPSDPLVNRVVVNSLHKPEDLALLFEVLEAYITTCQTNFR
ncbi:MAG: aminotransferase class I/II-fold pyridoxal phosphate-dependent enzyme, partial [Saprospiraceae bacterium]|nr:aminotransferase class I/II-fold pyridoxal phosphate-dependent enzyme [Saprospiraceae bacterium]